jgi:protein O-GlcNAc transferase
VNATDNAALQSALTALQTGRVSDAERQFKTILAAQPRHVGALNLLGVLLTQIGRFAEAETYLRRAIAEQPKSDATLYNYGLVLKALNRAPEAFESFSQALKVNPSVAETWNNRGTVLNDLERYDEAIADFDRAIRLSPRYAEALCNKGKSLTLLRRFDDALAAFDSALALKPDLAEAWLGRGKILSEVKRYQEALAAFDRALASKPQMADAWLGRGDILAELGRHADALASYDKALASKTDLTEAAWFNRATALWRLGRYDDALTAYDCSLALNPDLVGAVLGRGNVFVELKRYDEALAAYDKALTSAPDLPPAWLGRGRVFHELGRNEQAIAAFDRALAVEPDLVEAWANRGNVLAELKRYEDAARAYDRAIALKPDLAEARLGRGNVHFKLKRWNDALAAYDKALSFKPDFAEAWVGRGSVLNDFERHHDALAAYDRALSLNADLATAWAGRANVFFKLKKFDDALAACDRALVVKPDFADAWMARGSVFIELKQYDDAFVCYDKALALDPDLDYAPGCRLYARLHSCNWSDLEADVAALLAMLRDGKPSGVPLALLGTAASAADQLQCAKRTMQNLPAFPAIWRGDVYSHDRIRLAYLSADLHEHPVAYLMAGVFEHHDRSRFEVTALSLGEDDNSEFGARVRASFERFVDVPFRSSRDIADLIRQLEIDIVVDLNGFTQGGRPEILARRPAPVQVNYLGYAGTMGSDHFDYIIADATVIPEDHFQFYSENVVWLPDSFMANDAARRIAERTPGRGELNLPESGFVFCCFNQSHKIDPAIFDVWMRLLNAVDGSVLWMRELSPAATDNLRREAAARGVRPERLVFASPVPQVADHLARHRQADLFLDTLHYNAHATACDALWAGVPVVTRRGATFAGRVGASLLRATGLPELVTDSLEDYEALALQLVRDRSHLASIKARLARNRDSCALFDTKTFTRHIEAAYETMWKSCESGRLPESFAITGT